MKAELIKQLYDEGKITFEQAMTLASSEEVQIPSPVESGLSPIRRAIQKVSKKEIFIKSLIDDIVEHRESDEADDYGTLLSFDTDKVVEYMHSIGWTWGGRDVTVESFREMLRSYLRDVISRTISDYLAGDWKDDYSELSGQWPCYNCISGGGIEVESWYNDEEKIIEAGAKFVIEESTADKSVKDLNESNIS